MEMTKRNNPCLKMLNLSNIHEVGEGFKELRIVPLSISYEIEPCGISKVAELYKKNKLRVLKRLRRTTSEAWERGW